MMLMKPIASSCYGGDSDGRDDRDQRPHDGVGCTERHIVHGGTATNNRNRVVIARFEKTKGGEEPFGEQKMATETLCTGLNTSDRPKSRDVWQVWSHRMSHGPALCVWSIVCYGFDEGTDGHRKPKRGFEGGSR